MSDTPKEVKQMDEKTREFAAVLIFRKTSLSNELQSVQSQLDQLVSLYGDFKPSVEPVQKLTLTPKESIKEGTNDAT